MPLDPRAQRFLTMLGASGTREAAPSIDDRRRGFAMLLQHAGVPGPSLPSRDLVLTGSTGDLPARLFEPAERLDAPCAGLVFFHGGGLVAGSIDTHHAVCRILAAASGCRIVSVGYRLAPEHPFPAAVEDALAATASIRRLASDLGIDSQRLAVGGDSVGANLAANVAREAGAGLRAHLLICPVLDARGEGESHRLFGQGFFLESAAMEQDLAAYGGATALDRDDPRVSPLRAIDLRGLPPAIVATAEYDPVRNDGATYAQRLEQAGVPVRYICHPGMIHLFYAFGRLIPAGPAALDRAGRQLAELMAA